MGDDLSEYPRSGVPAHLARDMTLAEQHEWLTAAARRSAVSRRGLLRGGALTAASLAAGPLLLPGTASAATRSRISGRHIAFGRDPRTAMLLTAQVNAQTSQTLGVRDASPGRTRFFLDYGTDKHYGHTLALEVDDLTTVTPSVYTGQQFYLHAKLNHLSPGHRYHYRFRSSDGFKTDDQSFVTAPAANRPFRFTALGDEGTSTGLTGFMGKSAAAQMVASIDSRIKPDFHLVAGDICYADPSGDGLKPPTDDFDPYQWDYYLAQIERSAKHTPWMFGTGNHDMEAVYSDDGYRGHEHRLAFPGNGAPGCPSTYHFTYGNVGIISVDPNDVSYEIPANYGYSGGRQATWLAHTLDTMRSDPAIDFIVVFHHHCPYSTTSNHASEGGLRDRFVPLYDAFNVDLVISGHNHVYERADPIRAGVPTRRSSLGDTYSPTSVGTTYITAGSGGKSLYSFPAPDYNATGGTQVDSVDSYFWSPGSVMTPETVAWSRVRYTGFAFLVVDVTPASKPGGRTTLTARAMAADGVTAIDRVTLERHAHKA